MWQRIGGMRSSAMLTAGWKALTSDRAAFAFVIAFWTCVLAAVARMYGLW